MSKLQLPKSPLAGTPTLSKSHPDGCVSFSFKYFDCTHKKFCIKNHDASWYARVLERLQDESRKTPDELRKNTQHSHKIEWSKTSESSFGLKNEANLVGEPWQFAIEKALGRVHGFFIGSIFYVVWLDRHHKLYPGGKN